MKQHLLPFALAVSLVFNGAVVVGFMLGGGAPGLRGPGGHRPPHGPVAAGLDLDRAARILDVSPEQRAKFEEIKAERDRIFPAIDEESQLLELDLREELAKETADSATVREILERQSQLSRDRRMAQADLFERFQQTLTPEQRQRLHQAMSARGRGEEPPPSAIRRFDADGDGHLNPEERRAADSELRARRGPRGPRGGPEFRDGLPPIWPFFDRDEDGVLNAEERAERDEFLRTHKPSRAFRPDDRAGREGNRPEGGPRE